MSEGGFFERFDSSDGERLRPTMAAASGWGPDSMRGMAVGGALAREAERVVLSTGRTDLRPVRWTLDLCRPAQLVETGITARVVREGRRVCLVDAELVQEGRLVARASGLFAVPSASPRGSVWSPPRDALIPPPDDMPPLRGALRHYFTDGPGWRTRDGGHRTEGRRQSWHAPFPIVRGEPVSRFQWVASVADVANVVANWGTCDLEFINADVTVNMVRLPRADELGLSGSEHLKDAGIAVGGAVLFDRDGPFGTVTVSALANAEHAVDPSLQGSV